MTELGEQARWLIERSRAAHQPSAANRAHVWWRVERELPAKGGMPGQWRRWFFSAGIAAGLLGVGGSALAWFAASSTREAPVAAPVSHQAEQMGAAVALPKASSARKTLEKERAEEPEAIAEPAIRPTRSTSWRVRSASQRKAPLRTGAKASPSATKPAADKSTLAEETALIARAQLATNRGDATQALATLERYQRDHESGALAEEGGAAKVFALCAMGKRGQAAREAGRFLARWPRSPQTAAIRASCAFADER